jgi:hypothetical protein
MTRIVNLAVVGWLVLGVVGCASVSKTDLGEMPDWFIESPQSPDYLYAATTQTSQDLQLAIDKASTSGRAEIVRQVELKVGGLTKQFSEETGLAPEAILLQNFVQAGRLVSSASMSGSRVKSKKIVRQGKVWRAYVLVEYPIGVANQALMKQIRSREDMYTRFQATKAFEELDKEVKKFEDRGKSQSQP